MQAPPTGVACFKCGKTGHWSRDCTVPPSEWIRKALPARPKPTEAAAIPGAAPHPQRQEAAQPSFAQYGNSATPGTAPRTLPKGQGCFKCGKTGHWSRDCTAPPSEQLPKTPFIPSAAHGPNILDTDPPTASIALKPRKADAKKQRRVKIRFEHLKEKDAVAEVFHQFPERFARQFKGKGHEVSDLRRLLEMYRSWQRKYFPRHDFDEAIHQIADLGRSHRLKVELREMREGVLKMIKNEEQEAADKAAAAAAEAAQQADGEGAEATADAMEGAEDAGPAAEWDDDDDDDDLVALQQQGWEEEADAAPLDMLDAFAPAQATAQVQGAEPMDIDASLEDQELLALAAAPPSQQEAGNNVASSEPSHQPLLDSHQISPEDEELLALAEAPLSQVHEAQPPAQGAAAMVMQGSHQISPEDEELLALAAEPLSQVQEAQPSAQDAAATQQCPQISPEDEELLALAAAPLSQPEAPQASPNALRAPPAQSTWEMSAEDEELLALASAPEPQPGTAPAAQPGGVPPISSPGDKEPSALAAAVPLSQPGTLQAVAAVEKGKRPQPSAQAQARAGFEQLDPPPQVSSTIEDREGGADCSSHAPAPRSQADQSPSPQQLSAGARVAPQGSKADALASPDHGELLMLAPSPSSCHRHSDGIISQPHITAKHDAVLPGKENAADRANLKAVTLDTYSSDKQTTTAVDNLPSASTARLDGADDEDAELLALL